MIPISSHLTKRISTVLSSLSASWPLVAENSRNGRMKKRADDEPGERGRQPGDLQLVGDEHGERELEQVVVAGAEELGPEKRCEAALPEQRELVRRPACGVPAGEGTACAAVDIEAGVHEAVSLCGV